MNLVQRHFNLVSGKYSTASNSGIWKIFRNQESKAIFATLPSVYPGMKALDLGCGAGFYSQLLVKWGFSKVTSVDFSKDMLAQLKGSEFEKIESDIENFVSTEKYDYVVCAGALEFIKNPDIVFINVKKMLKPQAHFVVLIPDSHFLSVFYKLYHRLHKIEVQIFNQTQLEDFAIKAGLKLASSSTVFPFAKILKFT